MGAKLTEIVRARQGRFTLSVIDAVRGPTHQSHVLTKIEFLQRIESAAASRAEMARVLGLAPARVTEMMKGERDLSYDEACKLSNHYRIGQDGGDLALPTASSFEDMVSEHGFVLIEELDLALGMGATFLDPNRTPESLGMVPFKEDWIRDMFRGSIAHLRVVRGRGDSMEPTIRDGDFVLIDTSRRRLDEQDVVWAVAYGDLGMIRRLRQLPSGPVLMMPDNAVVRPSEAFDGELHIVGRVIWIGRRM